MNIVRQKRQTLRDFRVIVVTFYHDYVDESPKNKTEKSCGLFSGTHTNNHHLSLILRDRHRVESWRRIHDVKFMSRGCRRDKEIYRHFGERVGSIDEFRCTRRVSTIYQVSPYTCIHILYPCLLYSDLLYNSDSQTFLFAEPSRSKEKNLRSPKTTNISLGFRPHEKRLLQMPS